MDGIPFTFKWILDTRNHSMGHRSYYFHKFAFISTSVSVLGPATSIDFDVQSQKPNRNEPKSTQIYL